MSAFSEIKHLSKEDIIKNGSIFTPAKLVNLVKDLCGDVIDSSSTILDMGSGYGAFIDVFSKLSSNCIGTDCDSVSIQFLKSSFPNVEFYEENSILNVSREKYGLDSDSKIVIVGNPPYNDITSIYKKGEKGSLICDDDLISRDFGISFLKAYNKLKANYICVLHPLAYLIKKQNFNSLGAFKDNYILKKATIFSSKLFESIRKSASEFAVVAAFYELNSSGMTYDYIKDFTFGVIDSNAKFCLNSLETIDGKIAKYPAKGSIEHLQFYTLRDMNALMRNATFVNGPIYNGVDVNVKNLYQYAWLYFIKYNFKSKNMFLYSNISPVYSSDIEKRKYKNLLVSYCYNNCEIVRNEYTAEELENEYGPLASEFEELNALLSKIYID